MKVKRMYVLILFLVFLFVENTSYSQNYEQTYSFVRIEDGDTIKIKKDGGKSGEELRLQLYGIDAPESIENPKLILDVKRIKLPKEDIIELGQKSASFLYRLIKLNNNKIQLKEKLDKKDKYGRYLVEIFVTSNKESVNSYMIKKGYAIALKNDDGLKNSKLIKHQKQAIEAKEGLWGMHGEIMQKWSDVKKNE